MSIGFCNYSTRGYDRVCLHVYTGSVSSIGTRFCCSSLFRRQSCIIRIFGFFSVCCFVHLLFDISKKDISCLSVSVYIGQEGKCQGFVFFRLDIVGQLCKHIYPAGGGTVVQQLCRACCQYSIRVCQSG